jgi:hypothetical protein
MAAAAISAPNKIGSFLIPWHSFPVIPTAAHHRLAG